jgi:hypothetical protein
MIPNYPKIIQSIIVPAMIQNRAKIVNIYKIVINMILKHQKCLHLIELELLESN